MTASRHRPGYPGAQAHSTGGSARCRRRPAALDTTQVRREPVSAGLLVGDRAVRVEILKPVGRQANVANRFTCPLHKIANRGRVHDDSGPTPFQRIRTTFQNVYVPALVSKNQSCGETAERPSNHNGPHHAALHAGENSWRARGRGEREPYLPGSPPRRRLSLALPAIVVGASTTASYPLAGKSSIAQPDCVAGR